MKAMKQTRWGIVLSLGLAFAAGAAAGMFIDRVFFFPRGHPAPARRRTSGRRTSASPGAKARMEEIFKKNDGRGSTPCGPISISIWEDPGEIRKEVIPSDPGTKSQAKRHDGKIPQVAEQEFRFPAVRPGPAPGRRLLEGEQR